MHNVVARHLFVFLLLCSLDVATSRVRADDAMPFMTDWSMLQSVVVTIASGKAPFFETSELGPPPPSGALFGSSLAVWKDSASGVRWSLVGAPGDDSNRGAAYLFELIPGADHWHQVLRIAPTELATNDAFGTSVAIQGTSLAIGAPGRTVNGHVKSGQVYLYDVDYATYNFALRDTLKGAAADNIGTGTSVALAGNIVFAGAPNASGNGAVWVALRSGNTWPFTQAIQPSGSLDGHSFGASLSMDGSRLIVGMPNDGSGGAFSGLAFTFRLSGSTWTQEQRIVAPDATTYNHFGSSVAIYGDVIAVGARDHDAAKGAVYSYSFDRSASAWNYQSTLTVDGASQFGVSVSLTSGLLAVGAPDTGGSTCCNGNIYLFSGSPSSWRSIAIPPHALGGKYGAAVSLTSDTLLAAAPLAYQSPATGAAISYSFDGTSWNAQRQFVALADSDQQFGSSVAISADTAIVQAPRNSTGPDSMTRFFKVGVDGIWQKFLEIDNAPGQFVGNFVGCRPVSLDGDTALIGDPLQTVAGTEIGATYVYRRSTSGSWNREATLINLSGTPGDGLGCATAISGDVAVVGAPGVNRYEGAAYVFVRSGTTWSLRQTLTAPDAPLQSLFGAAVATSNGTVVVGAPGRSDGSTYLFTSSGSTWALQKQLKFATPTPDFGTSLAISGETLAVGAVEADDDAGAVYLFRNAGGTWPLEQKISGEGATSFLGAAVALSKNDLAIGSFGSSNVLIYSRRGTAWQPRAALNGDGGSFGFSLGYTAGNLIIGAPTEEGGRAYILKDDRIFTDGIE
jgi:hypothetical protein